MLIGTVHARSGYRA